MKSINIIKKLEKEGYSITFKKWHYWDNVPHVEFDTFSFAIAEHVEKNGWLGCNLNFIFSHVQQALYVAQKNNPTILKKIEESPAQEYYYSRYLILSMQDYYLYEKRYFPYDNYYKILEKLKKEYN